MNKTFNFDIFLNSIRCLFPRWSFFQSTDYQFKLEIRDFKEQQWLKVDFPQNRKFYNIFLNPLCNLNLAQVNVIEHFAEVIQLNSTNNQYLQIKKNTSLKLIKSLVLIQIEEKKLSQDIFQFRVVAENLNEIIEIYKSDEIQNQ